MSSEISSMGPAVTASWRPSAFAPPCSNASMHCKLDRLTASTIGGASPPSSRSAPAAVSSFTICTHSASLIFPQPSNCPDTAQRTAFRPKSSTGEGSAFASRRTRAASIFFTMQARASGVTPTELRTLRFALNSMTASMMRAQPGNSGLLARTCNKHINSEPPSGRIGALTEAPASTSRRARPKSPRSVASWRSSFATRIREAVGMGPSGLPMAVHDGRRGGGEGRNASCESDPPEFSSKSQLAVGGLAKSSVHPSATWPEVWSSSSPSSPSEQSNSSASRITRSAPRPQRSNGNSCIRAASPAVSSPAGIARAARSRRQLPPEHSGYKGGRACARVPR
mmetsp:Transcript_113979/g.329231  ORF Transcript_113979/g.329231 Transcript_113979/m.329231 type:complete len:339 (+) Transcript_113979:2748-3764(+)